MDRSSELAIVAGAAGCFVVAAWAAGPLVFDGEPLDLGAGIFMTPTGRIIVHEAVAAGPMRIPDEQEYFGEMDPPAPARAVSGEAAGAPLALKPAVR